MTAPHAPSQGVLSCLCPLPGKVSHWSPSQQATEDTLTTHPPPTPTHSRLLEKLFLSVHSEPLGCLKGTQVEDKPSETIRRQKGGHAGVCVTCTRQIRRRSMGSGRRDFRFEGVVAERRLREAKDSGGRR